MLRRSRGTRTSTSRVALTDPCRFAATPPAIKYRTRWRLRSLHTRRTRLSVPGVRLGMAPTLVFVPRPERSHERLEWVGCQLDEIAVQELARGQPCGRAWSRCAAARRPARRRARQWAHRGDYNGVSVNCAREVTMRRTALVMMFTLMLSCGLTSQAGAQFASVFDRTPDRPWVGPEYLGESAPGLAHRRRRARVQHRRSRALADPADSRVERQARPIHVVNRHCAMDPFCRQDTQRLDRLPPRRPRPFRRPSGRQRCMERGSRRACGRTGASS